MSDPVTLAIATAVAGKVSESLTDAAKALLTRLRKAIRHRGAEEPDTPATLASAQDDPDDETTVRQLAERLANSDDPEIRRLTTELRPHFATGEGAVVNTVHGQVTGTVIQGRNISGGIQLG